MAKITADEARRELIGDYDTVGYSAEQARCIEKRVLALVDEGLTRGQACRRAYSEWTPSRPAFRGFELRRAHAFLYARVRAAVSPAIEHGEHPAQVKFRVPWSETERFCKFIGQDPDEVKRADAERIKLSVELRRILSEEGPQTAAGLMAVTGASAADVQAALRLLGIYGSSRGRRIGDSADLDLYRLPREPA